MQRTTMPLPKTLTLKKRSQQLAVEFDDGVNGSLSAEFLRVHSPSAEVTGHSPGEGQLVTGKEFVEIVQIEPIGRYAVRIIFNDGHDSGLYTWKLLHEFCSEHEARWQRYLQRLTEAGVSRVSVQ